MGEELFQMEIETIDGFTVLTPLVRELTFKNSKDFLSHAKSCVEKERMRVILCLKNIEIIDSMSLGTLVALLKHVRKLDGDVVVTDLGEALKILFSLLNFDNVFCCFPNVEEAMRKYSPLG